MFESHPIQKEVTNFTVKAFKQHTHRRGIAWSCNLYDGSKKIASVSQAGEGGCNDYHFSKGHSEKDLIAFLRKIKFDDMLREAAYAGDKPLHAGDKEINDEFLLSGFMEYLIDCFEAEKHQKAYDRKLKKACESGICYGTDSGYGRVGFKMTFANMLDAQPRAIVLPQIQKAYDMAMNSLEKGDKILNSDEQLASLGIKR